MCNPKPSSFITTTHINPAMPISIFPQHSNLSQFRYDTTIKPFFSFSLYLSFEQMDPALPIVAFSVLLGAIIAFLFFNSYFRKRQSEVRSIANPDPGPLSDPKKLSSKKPHHHSKPHSLSSDKVIYLFICLFSK